LSVEECFNEASIKLYKTSIKWNR